jgi:hypothetical protein
MGQSKGQSTNLDKPALVRGAMVPASLALFEWISAKGGNSVVGCPVVSRSGMETKFESPKECSPGSAILD